MADHTEFVTALVGYLTGRIPQNVALDGKGDFWDWLRRQCPGIDQVTLDKLNDISCVLGQHPMIHLGRAQHG
jgi:hypothetical protein